MSDTTETTVDTTARITALEAQLRENETAAQARVVRAELKAEAVRAGMIDLDGLKLLDLNGVTLNAAGEVDGAGALLRDFKRAKPWLFAAPSSSSTAAAPQAPAPRGKLATEMSDAEWSRARAEILKRR